MDAHPRSRLRHIPLLTLLLTAAIQPAALEAQSCAGQIPAFAAPESLWLDGIFRPGETDLPNNQLPAERDSTTWDSIGPPTCATGEEIFQGLDVAGDYLYVAYNTGFSIWDISGVHAEDPERIKVRDGWSCTGTPCQVACGPFLSFPGPSESKFLVEDIVVLPEPGTTNVTIAVSGKNPVGISLWRFDTATEALTAVYQDTTRVSRQVRLVPVTGGLGATTLYAFSSFGNGLAVYDVSQALATGPCLEVSGLDCPGVDLGNLGSISSGRFLDVLQRPTGEILVAAADGQLMPQGLELWQVDDPSSPGAAIQLFDGLDYRTFGTALFNHEGNDYLAVLERDGSLNVIKIFNVNACSGGPCSLGTPVFDAIGVPPRLSHQFLTFSNAGGTPFLYYGLEGGFGGPKVEQLLDLTSLGRPGQNITEMTDGGPTYFDACEQADLDYWPWYYPGNEFGLNNLTPRIGKFHPDTRFFYRAAGGILDVHVWEAEPTTTTTVSDPDPEGLYWMGDEITFEAAGSNGCIPAGTWNWTPSTPPEIDAVMVDETGDQVTFRFECGLGGDDRCGDALVSVAGANSDPSCAGAVETAAAVTLKDPDVEITSIDPSSGTFTQCAGVDFTARLQGRGPVDLDWSVRRDPALDPQQTFNETLTQEDLATSTPMFTWDTAAAVFAGIFADGFESGDVSAWGQPPLLAESFHIAVALGGGGASASATVELTSCPQ